MRRLLDWAFGPDVSRWVSRAVCGSCGAEVQVFSTACDECSYSKGGRSISLCQRYRTLTYRTGAVEHEIDPDSPSAGGAPTDG